MAASGRAVVLAAIRAGLPVPLPVTALWKDDLATRVELASLDAEDVAALLATVLGDPVDGSATRQFIERSGGSTVLLRELVIGALEAGVLVDIDGLWRLAAPIPVSDRLVELVAARMADLAEPARLAFELIALGEPLLVDAISPHVEPDVLDEIEARGRVVIERTPSGGMGGHLRVRCANPLVAEVVRAGLPTMRARRLRLLLADAIDEAAAALGRGTSLDRMTAVRLRVEADAPVDPAAALAAARRAWGTGDVALAHALGEAAIAGGAGFEAELVVAQAESQLGRGTAAEARLAALQQPAVGDEQLATVASARSENFVVWLADAGRAAEVMAAAEAAVTDERIRDDLAVKRALVLPMTWRRPAPNPVPRPPPFPPILLP